MTDQTSELTKLNDRSRDIFRRIVESYLTTGEPVGSRNLARVLPTTLSPASIRNVMTDLEHAGLIFAHIRLPDGCRHSWVCGCSWTACLKSAS